MKKLFRNFMFAAIAAFGMTSCDDVPAPFVEPGGGNNTGTWDAPLTVAELISNQTGNTVWVHGYIVGSIPEAAESTTLSNMTFTADGANIANICIAGSATETVVANCVPVQLPAGSDAREMLNLKVNPGKLGAEVWLKGTSEKYCGAPGLKSVSKFTLVAPTKEDDKENGDDPVTPGIAVTCSEAVELCNALADGATSEEAYTISGYITEIITAVSRDQQSFWMADTKDGGRVFQAYYANLPEGVAEFKVGSQVKITGKLKKFINNSGEVVPEIKNATVEIVSVGEGGDEGGDDNPATSEGIAVDGSMITLSAEGIAPGTESIFVDLNTFGYANATPVTTVEADGCIITFGSGINTTNAPMFYTATKGVRMYANNTVSFTADKTIATITLECDVYNGVNQVGNETRTLKVNDNVFLLTNAHTETKGGVQMRIKTVRFTFAE